MRPVASSVDAPEVSRSLASKAGYTFTILSDPNGEVIHRYNLTHSGAGEHGQDISRPAEFLVDHNGIIRRTNFAEDIRVRARAEDMLAQARKIN